MILKIKDALDTVRPDPKLIARTQALMDAEAEAPKKRGLVTAFPRRAAALAACLLLVVGLSAYVYAYRLPVSSVYIDAAPSLALEVSRAGTVVGVEYYDSAARGLVDEKALRGESAEDAVSLVVDAAKSGGYLGGDAVVSLAAAGRDSTQLLAACTRSVESRDSSLAVYATNVQPKLQSEAEQAAISPGKLSLIKMVQKLDSSATVSEYRGQTVTDIVDRLVYLTSDANTAAPEAEKKEVRSGIESVAGRRETAVPQQSAAPAPASQPVQQPAQAPQSAPRYSPTPASTYPVGTPPQAPAETQTPSAVTQAPAETPSGQSGQQPSETAQPAQPSGGQSGGQQPSGGETQPGQQTQTPSGPSQSGGQQTTPQPQTSASGGQQPQPSGGGTGSTAQPQPGGGDRSGVTASESGADRDAGGRAAGGQLPPAPSNGDTGR